VKRCVKEERRLFLPSRANAGCGFDAIGARRTCAVMVRGQQQDILLTPMMNEVCRCVGDPTPKDINAQSARQRKIRWHDPQI
jgi:hypothetical protein